MTVLEKLIVSRAERDAAALIREAKARRKSEIKEARKELDASYKKELELTKKRAEGESSVKAGELHTKFNKWKLKRETKAFMKLRSLLVEEIKSDPKKLFSKVLRQGKKEFKKPSIRVGPELEGLFRGSVIDKKISGMRIGQNGVYVSAEIEDVVDSYLEKNYSLILDRLFGGKK